MPSRTSTAARSRVRRCASRTRPGCGSTPTTCAAVRGEARQVEAGAAAEVEHGPAVPRDPRPPSRPRAGRRGRRRGSRSRRWRCAARCWGWVWRPGFELAALAPQPPAIGRSQIRTRPSGVCSCAARMPGVPCGATHSTLTSSSGASTLSPSHSLTRCGSPAISMPASEMVPSAPADGWRSADDLPLDEERELRVGDQAVDADLLPPELGAVGAVPVAGDRGAAEALLDGRDVRDRDDPAEPAAAERGAGPHGLAERRLVGGGVVEALDDLEVGRVGERKDHVARAEPRVHATVDELAPQRRAQAGGSARESVRSGGVRQVIQAHVRHSQPVAIATENRGRVLLTSRGRRWVSRSAGCSASADRDRRWASQWRTSSSYAARPISATSSGSLVT